MSSIRRSHGQPADLMTPIFLLRAGEAQPDVAPDPLRRAPPAFVGR